MSQTENIAASAAKLSSSWRDEVNQIRTRLNSLRARSCWDRGVNGFALDLLDSYEAICEYCENEGEQVPELCEKTLLNGATNWDSYCYGGFALIYDEDIAKALCTPSELKRTNSPGAMILIRALIFKPIVGLSIVPKILKRLR